MTAPDAKTVREIARRSLQNDLHRLMPSWFIQGVGSVIQAEAGPGVTVETFTAWHEAVVKEVAAAQITVSWPDEQQPADVVTAEQQQDGAVGGKGSERAASLLAFLDLHRERRGHDVIASLAVGDGRTVELTQVQLRAVLAERTALAARVAELESERDLWRTRAYQVGNMFIGERDPEVVPFLGVPGQEPAAAGTEES